MLIMIVTIFSFTRSELSSDYIVIVTVVFVLYAPTVALAQSAAKLTISVSQKFAFSEFAILF